MASGASHSIGARYRYTPNLDSHTAYEAKPPTNMNAEAPAGIPWNADLRVTRAMHQRTASNASRRYRTGRCQSLNDASLTVRESITHTNGKSAARIADLGTNRKSAGATTPTNSGRELKNRTNGNSGSPNRLHICQSQKPFRSSHVATAPAPNATATSTRRPSARTRNEQPRAKPTVNKATVIFSPTPIPPIAPANPAQPIATDSGAVSRRRRFASR